MDLHKISSKISSAQESQASSRALDQTQDNVHNTLFSNNNHIVQSATISLSNNLSESDEQIIGQLKALMEEKEIPSWKDIIIKFNELTANGKTAIMNYCIHSVDKNISLLYMGHFYLAIKDPVNAEACWIKSATEGNNKAMYNLSIFCQRENRLLDAIQWLEKSAKCGNFRAISKISILYGEAQSLESMNKNTIQWWELGALLGNDKAMFNLGRLNYKENRIFEAKLVV